MSKTQMIAAIGAALAWAGPVLAATAPPMPGSLQVDKAYLPYTVVVVLAAVVLGAAFKSAKRSHLD